MATNDHRRSASIHALRATLPVLLLMGAPAPAASPHAPGALVAVSSNFAEPAREFAGAFHRETGLRVELALGATGKHYLQIINGAPFDAFLAADAERPRLLEASGRAVEGSRFVYAVGRLALWSRQPGLDLVEARALASFESGGVAIAKPELAPYGLAARQTLEHLGLWGAMEERIVFGQNIGQAFAFVHTGNARAGFVALSQVVTIPESQRGSLWVVPADYHEPILQEAVLLTDNSAARAFLEFLRSPASQARLADYGYTSALLDDSTTTTLTIRPRR
jgi:molybdate transport system substrate-binding protein